MSKRFLLSVAIVLATFTTHSKNLHAVEIDSNVDQLSAGNSISNATLCTSDAGCDDQDPCTLESCYFGGLQQEEARQGICIVALGPRPDGCEVPAPESCEEFPGQHCCILQSDCDDGNPNTVDICVNMDSEVGYCENNPLETVCDDNDPCTRDERISQTACTFIPIEGCPAPETPPTLPPVEAPPAVIEEPPAPAVAPTPEYMFGSGCALGASSLNPWMTWIFFSPILAMYFSRKQKH